MKDALKYIYDALGRRDKRGEAAYAENSQLV